MQKKPSQMLREKKYDEISSEVQSVQFELLKELLPIICFGILNVILGILYLVFSTDGEYNNNCGNQQFKNWGIAYGVFLNLGGISVFNFLIQSYLFQNSIQYESLSKCFLYMMGLPYVICPLGLFIVGDTSCGYLFSMNIVLIILFVLGVIGGLVTCYYLFSQGMKKAYR
ncbi:hypothetical protein ABPG74_007006 [Tetrahymena malaccensis]